MKHFRIDSKVVVVTGAAGLLGEMHGKAIIEAGGIPVMLDINQKKLEDVCRHLNAEYEGAIILQYVTDITLKKEIENVLDDIKGRGYTIYGLINNAANNPDMKNTVGGLGRFEDFPVTLWEKDLSVGLTGAFLCSQVFGNHMVANKQGVIINIASDLGLIAPTQSLYEIEGVQEEMQPKKPVTYSVVKTGIIGLTRYLSTYWATKNVRVNSVALGGIYNNQSQQFVEKVQKQIPMGRMADADEYICSVIYMLSYASSYMTGTVVSIDGGRTAW